MHWKTYYWLREEAEPANILSWLVMGQRFGLTKAEVFDTNDDIL